MKESVGILGITNIVIFFIVLFTGYLSLSINQTRSYNVKDQVIEIIEKHTGIDNTTIAEIVDYLSSEGYRTLGRCESGALGITDSAVNGPTKAYVCIECFKANKNMNDTYGEFPPIAYFKVTVFNSLDVPLVRQAFHVNLTGTTKTIYYPVDERDICK